MYEPENADISELTITSSDSTIFSITQDSQNKANFSFVAESEGSVTLTATCGNVSTTYDVEVTASVYSLGIDVGGKTTFVAGETGEGLINYEPSSSDISALTITSSDDSVFAVVQDESDKSAFTYEAVGVGTATLTATCGDIFTTLELSVTGE